MNVDVNTIINRVSEKLQGTEGGQMEVKGELTDITVRMNEITLKELESMTIKVNNTEILLREVARDPCGKFSQGNPA
jgi:multidrug efflux pump subunit AcrB